MGAVQRLPVGCCMGYESHLEVPLVNYENLPIIGSIGRDRRAVAGLRSHWCDDALACYCFRIKIRWAARHSVELPKEMGQHR